jgi:hypothetical protein
MNIYELYGRLAEERQAVIEAHAQENAAHLATIEVLRRVSVGELRPDDVEVTSPSWRLVPAPRAVI